MSRLMVLALIFSLGHAPVAIAGETLLESARRVTRQLAQTQPPPSVNAAAVKRVRSGSDLQLAQGSSGLASSGIRKRTKVLFVVALAAVFSGIAYGIDQGVEDTTPSSLGLR